VVRAHAGHVVAVGALRRSETGAYHVVVIGGSPEA
jgi:hypothetical protein